MMSHDVRTVLHRFEGGALRSLNFAQVEDIHFLICAVPWLILICEKREECGMGLGRPLK